MGMSYNSDALWFSSERFFVGLSAIVGLTALPSQESLVIKNVSSIGSSCWLGGETLSIGGLNGYLFGQSEVLNLDARGTIFFTATGATAVIQALRGFSGA